MDIHAIGKYKRMILELKLSLIGEDGLDNIKELLEKVKSCFASLFTARAVYYRQKKGFQHDKSYLAAVVQRMIDSEKSGVVFSRNPVRNDDNIVMEAVWGLGEGIVSGMIKPDHYAVNSNLNDFNITECQVVEKKVAVVRISS